MSFLKRLAQGVQSPEKAAVDLPQETPAPQPAVSVAPAKPMTLAQKLAAARTEKTSDAKPTETVVAEQPKKSSLAMALANVQKVGKETVADPGGVADGKTSEHSQVGFPAPTELQVDGTGFTDEQVDRFKRAYNGLRVAVAENEGIGEALRHCMMILRSVPSFAENLGPEDIGLFVRALRMSYGKAITRKETRRENTSKKAKGVSSIASTFSELGGFGDIDLGKM